MDLNLGLSLVKLQMLRVIFIFFFFFLCPLKDSLLNGKPDLFYILEQAVEVLP